jgi:threonine/homoserine/homoserine lactone efflux protein
MLIDYLIISSLGMGSAIVGALPFGLVNLTVLNVTFEKGNGAAIKIAHGAALVEVVFGITALVAGGMLASHIEGNIIVSYITAGVLIIGGVFFVSKKQRNSDQRKPGFSGFLKGILLNLISIQVFLFWILAITFLSSRELLQYDLLSILFFVSGIWLGKMAVLWMYMNLSNRILSRSRIISKNINTIIGLVLFGLAFVQVLKI